MYLKKTAVRFFLILFLSSLQIYADKSKCNEVKPELWFKDIFFEDESLNFETIGVLSLAYSKGSDIGETFSAAEKINPKDLNTWYESWKTLGYRIKDNADNYIENGHIQSGRSAYFRAAIYLWKAGFYLIGTKDSSKAVELYKTAVNCFGKAIEGLPHIKKVKIPYKNSSLPGYLLIAQNSDKARPVLIVHSGFDGTKELTFFEIGDEALNRGYNCLIFEGPGQGEARWKNNLNFTYKWEEPVKAAIDFLKNCKDIKISSIALMGRSMGGYLAPRAAAFDKRINACIANGGLYDLGKPVIKKFSPELLKLMKENPKAFDKIINDYMDKKLSIQMNWFFNNGMWAFGVESPAEFLKKLQKYTLNGVADKITCPVLVVDTTEDMFAGNQARMLYDNLKCPKEYMLFGENDSAELHCQLGALAVSNERIFNWLDKTLNFNLQKK